MIYLDTSVALAHLLVEDRRPADSLWSERLVSSRLLTYECWTRIHAGGKTASHADRLRELLDRLMLVELTPPVFGRALEPFPVPVRTLDALHLASIEHLRTAGQDVTLATYDARLASAARALKIPVVEP
jgi:predicted nucleic acid-binding protein